MSIKAFRLFVSSTFIDFSAERNLLQLKVFPALAAYCAAKGYQFYPLDLRWGVNEEAQLDQRTAEICLNEVRAAKLDYPPPNFLIMIGNRYGFVPLPYAIAQDEFEAILDWFRAEGRQDAVRSLTSIYRLDDNHVVPLGLLQTALNGSFLARAIRRWRGSTAKADRVLVGAYTLRSRVEELPLLKSAEAWAEREAQLRALLQEAADALLALGKISSSTHERYFLSLTHQEIIHGLLAYRPAFDDAPSPASSLADGPPAIAFIREIANELGATASVLQKYFQPSPQLDALKDSITCILPSDHIITLPAVIAPDASPSQTYLTDFAAQVRAKLQKAIDSYVARVEAMEREPDYELESERDAHHSFARRKLEIFVGREEILATIARFIAGDDERPLVVYGRSGLGKSSIMARAIADAEAAAGAPVIARFVGASASSSSLRALLISVIDDLAAHGAVDKPAGFELDANKFDAQISNLLTSINSRAIIFLDALDQLQKPYNFWWLPAELPKHLKVVISVLGDPDYESESNVYRSFRDRFDPGTFVEIGPLDEAQSGEILSALEQRTKHRLQNGQREYLIQKCDSAGGSPLYLRTAFEIARSWKSYHPAGVGRHVLADDTSSVIAQFIAELSSVQHHEPELVSRTLGYLAAAKDGLSAKELTDVLSRDPAVMQAISSHQFGPPADQLPPSMWVRLNRDLSPFLVEKLIDDQPLLQFFHPQVAAVARAQQYSRCKTELHAALVTYFDFRLSESEGRNTYSKRSLSELPYQLYGAENTSRLDEILTSPDWMQQKLNAFGPQALFVDYEQFGRGLVQNLIGKTLRLTTGICARDRRQLLPQLLGRLLACKDPGVSAFLDECHRHLSTPAILTQRQSLTPPGAETTRLEGCTGAVTALVVLPDGRLASGSERETAIQFWDARRGSESARIDAGRKQSVTALVVLPDGRLACSGDESSLTRPWGVIRLWDVASGAETARLVGKEIYHVTAMAVLPDGRLAAGCGASIRLWDTRSGTETACLSPSDRRAFDGSDVTALAVLPDGQLASGSKDQLVRVWDPKRGVETGRLDVYTGPVTSLVVLPDGRLASGSDEGNAIGLWDLSSADATWLEGFTGGVQALAVLHDGRLASASGSGAGDNTIRLWDVTDGKVTSSLAGHSSVVTSLAVLPDGRLASGSWDQTIRLWDVSNSTSRQTSLEGHTGAAWALAVLRDERLASGSEDETIRLWDPKSGAEVARLAGHSRRVTALAQLLDGRIASASDDESIRLWDTTNWVETARLVGHTRQVRALAVLPNGRLASGSLDATVRLWDVRRGVETGCLDLHPGEGVVEEGVAAMAILPDGRLATGCRDNTIRLWDVTSGAETVRLEGHTSDVKALAVLPNGRLASGSDDGTIRLWDVRSGSETACLTGHTDRVWALAVLPDGRLISGSWDRSLRLWNLRSRTVTACLEVDAPIVSLIAHHDCRLVAGDNLGRLHWLMVVD
jgi:WD40 repeat protein